MNEILATLPSLQAYLLLAAMLFSIGVWGLINSRNAVRVLMSIELMLNAVNINLMAFSSYVDGDLYAQKNPSNRWTGGKAGEDDWETVHTSSSDDSASEGEAPSRIV